MSQVVGRGIPLVGNDIDTDRIIPARFLRCVTFDGLGAQVFRDDRAQGNHPFDQAVYQGATILVVNRNFGCGSSREHAPQALAKWGIQAVVGESFAEIFFGNCLALGIPCVTTPQAPEIQQLLAETPQAAVTLDLTTNTLTVNQATFAISLPEGPRQMLLSGTWDACGQLVAQATAIGTTAKKLPYLVW
jgi:3-isopropylmalate/(R)-2-methylmalate dehydratase small subunit